MRLVQRLVSLVTLVSLLVAGLTAGHRGNIWLVTGTGVMALAANITRSPQLVFKSDNVKLLRFWPYPWLSPDYFIRPSLTHSWHCIDEEFELEKLSGVGWVGVCECVADQRLTKSIKSSTSQELTGRSWEMTISLTIVHIIIHYIHCRCTDEDNPLNVDIINYLLMTSNVLFMKGKLYILNLVI